MNFFFVVPDSLLVVPLGLFILAASELESIELCLLGRVFWPVLLDFELDEFVPSPALS